MPKDSLFWLTASVKAEGRGTDSFSERTWAKLDGKISDIRYGASSVSDVSIDGSLEKNLLKWICLANTLGENGCLLKRDPPQARGEGDVDSGCGEHGFTGMHLMANPFATSFQLFAEVEVIWMKITRSTLR